jgi:hypothetical protein
VATGRPCKGSSKTAPEKDPRGVADPSLSENCFARPGCLQTEPQLFNDLTIRVTHIQKSFTSPPWRYSRPLGIDCRSVGLPLVDLAIEVRISEALSTTSCSFHRATRPASTSVWRPIVFAKAFVDHGQESVSRRTLPFVQPVPSVGR